MRPYFLLLLIAWLTGVLVGCKPSTPLANDSRQVQLADVVLQYQPSQLQTETPITLSAQVPAGWQLTRAELVGLSMDMLTLPLFFKNVDLPTSSTVVLGNKVDAASPTSDSADVSTAVHVALAPSTVPPSSTLPTAPMTLWRTELLLGACADPQMRWRLELTFVDAQGQQHFRSDELVVLRR